MAEFWADLMAWPHQGKAEVGHERGVLQAFWGTVGYPDPASLPGGVLFLPRLEHPLHSFTWGPHVCALHRSPSVSAKVLSLEGS